MANNHETLTSLFTDIADAIREKTGGTESIVADQFPEVIAEIDTQEDLDAEMVDQDDLIEAIAAGLVGKTLPGGGSSGGSSGSGGGSSGGSDRFYVSMGITGVVNNDIYAGAYTIT